MTGGTQGTNGSRSSEHSNVASATLDSKSMIAVVLAVGVLHPRVLERAALIQGRAPAAGR